MAAYRRSVPYGVLLGLLGAATVIALGQARAISRAATAERTPPGLRFLSDIAYRTDTGSRKTSLDLAAHERDIEGGRPALVFIHGGGWSAGDRRFYRRAMLQWASEGYVCIAPNYRLSGEAKFPAQIEDVRCAIRWLRAHAASYGVDPHRVAAYGVSAGAHLATLAAFAQPEEGLEVGPWQGQSSALQCVTARSGIYDLRPEALGPVGSGDLAVVNLLGAAADEVPELAAQASPMAFLDDSDPPVLVIHGTSDERIPHAAAERLAEECARLGVVCELLSLEGGGHGGARSPEFDARVESAMRQFLEKHLGGP